MIHIYKNELDEIDIKLITNEFVKVKESRIVTFGLLILKVCLLWFIYHYYWTNFFSILPFNTPWNQLENIENKWANVSMRGLWWGTYAAQIWILDLPLPPPRLPSFYLHVCFWATTSFPIRCVHKTSLLTPSPPHTNLHATTILLMMFLNTFLWKVINY